jgi:hypothetical protein
MAWKVIDQDAARRQGQECKTHSAHLVRKSRTKAQADTSPPALRYCLDGKSIDIAYHPGYIKTYDHVYQLALNLGLLHTPV